MTRLLLLEPQPGPRWAPFSGCRPVAELRAGVWRIRERWEGVTGLEAAALVGEHLAGFTEDGVPPVEHPGPVAGPALVAASRFAPSGEPVELPAAGRLVHEGQTVGWVVPEGASWSGPDDEGGDAVEIGGLLLEGAWDVITALELLLPADCQAALADGGGYEVPPGSIVLGDPADILSLSDRVEPGVVFDTRGGAIVIEEGAEVRAGARLEGPLFVGPASRILGGAVRGSVIGPECRVHGEVAGSVLLGYANKSHDGFLGHSVIGRWANLGAGTITSNLKNTYGEVALETAGERVATGRQFLGSLVGDHAKTAIGTLLGTGTIVGAGANVFGAGPVPKWVPPFAWGTGGSERVTEEGFVEVARRVLPRRHVAVTPAVEASLRATWTRLAGG
ncbi:MAG TPA: putative sugar nucleotidyl transferase [Gemmatimonadales bacterium]|nr:putative sugar nucleotidyl transferase [Gemmatimonadales bacterium]